MERCDRCGCVNAGPQPFRHCRVCRACLCASCWRDTWHESDHPGEES